MLPTNDCDYSSTSTPHQRSHRRLRVRDNRQGAGGETTLSKTRRGGIRHAVVQSSAIASPASPKLAPCPRDPVPGPAATAAALLFLPPSLSLVHPTLYLPASITVLLTPARNSARLPTPPRLPPTATTMPTTSATWTPQWTCRRRTTCRGPSSPRCCRPHRPQRGRGGGVQNTAPCRSRDHAATLPSTSAQSYLVVVIVSGLLAGRKQRWWWLLGSGGGDNREMFCVCVAEQVRITVCLLRFGVNGSFYLNAKKFSICSLVQNCTSLCASSVHICASSVHILCMCNGSALHIFVQGLCVVHGYGGICQFHTVCI